MTDFDGSDPKSSDDSTDPNSLDPDADSTKTNADSAELDADSTETNADSTETNADSTETNADSATSETDPTEANTAAADTTETATDSADSAEPDTADRHSTRRAVLGAGSVALTAGLAGCDHTPEGRVDTSGPMPSVTIKNARVVQTTADARLNNGSGSLPDPPIVAGEYATVVFDVEATNPENLPKTIPMSVVDKSGNVGKPRFLYREDIKAIDDGADPRAVFHERIHASGDTDSPPPAFEMPSGISELEITASHDNVKTNTVTLSEGSNADFEVTSVPTLRVAFIEAKDPGSVKSDIDISWGNSAGEATFYDRSVNSSVEYLQRVYPGSVVAYQHQSPLIANNHKTTSQAVLKDFEEAYRSLNQIKSHASFPQNGTVFSGPFTRSNAVSMMDPDAGGNFDAHVLICPRSFESGNQSYFAAHGSSGTLGRYYHDSAASGVREAGDAGNDNSHAGTTAQELGHQFSAGPYDDGSSDPFGQRRTDDDGNTVIDEDHANSGLVSVNYDLTDGTYSMVNDFEIVDGAFSNSGPPMESGKLAAEMHQSYMTYTNFDTWADSRIHRYLVEGGYSSGYSGSPAIDRLSDGTGRQADERREIRPVIDVFGSVLDDEIAVDETATYRTVPGGNEYSETETPNATPVELTLESPEGEPLAETVVTDTFYGSHEGPDQSPIRRFAASLPFPGEGVSVRVARADAETRVNPILGPLRSRVSAVPDAALAEGDETTARLSATLDTAAEQMAERAYGDAAATLAESFIGGVEAGIESYDAYANQPTPAQLVALAERQIGRLERLDTAESESATTGFGVDPAATYLHTASDDTAADAVPISLAETGVDPGQSVTLTRVGSYSKGGSGGQGLTAVFSASPELLAAEERDRVPDAIDAGAEYETAPTYYGNEPTDIPEDFQVANKDGSDPSVTVRVPEEATYLFVSAIDNLYSDNTDENGEFGLEITPA